MTLKVGKKYWTEGGELWLYIGDCRNGPVFEVISTKGQLELVNRNHNLHELKEQVVHVRWVGWYTNGLGDLRVGLYEVDPMTLPIHKGFTHLASHRVTYEQKFHE